MASLLDRSSSSLLDRFVAEVAVDLMLVMLETDESSSALAPPPILRSPELDKFNLLTLGDVFFVLSSRFNRNCSNLVNVRLLNAAFLTNMPPFGLQFSKYVTPLTEPSFLPRPMELPVRRTPTQSSPSAKDTGPRKAMIPCNFVAGEDALGEVGEGDDGDLCSM